ncbi:MAG: tRNA (cytidine(56)-2'-O)-methyltransferase [Thermoprotei archaeon]
MKIFVFRLGHRPERDKRVSTHCALVARAFGADGIIFDTVDEKIEKKIHDVINRFGGPFILKMGVSWRSFIKKWVENGDEVIHLTMYGLPLPSIIDKIKTSNKDKLIIIGASKVPKEIYEMATYNVSVTNQPHSEVAALAVFLDHLFEGKEFYKTFTNAKIQIIPSERGKKVINIKPNE